MKVSPYDALRDFILAGEPFEIIDGDNLYFQNDILTSILLANKLGNARILIVSVLGP